MAVFLVWKAAPGSTTAQEKLDYGTFLTLVKQGHVSSIKYDSSSGKITGAFSEGFTNNNDGKKEFTDPGPADHAARRRHRTVERARRRP